MSRVGRGGPTVGLRAALALAVLLAACDLPTDESSVFRVSVAEPSVRMLVGASRALTVSIEGGSLGLDEVRYSSRNPDVVRVSDTGVLLGVGVGTTVVHAGLRRFENAAGDSVVVEVQGTLALERVTPAQAAFGALVTAVGRGLDPSNLTVLSIGSIPASVESWVPAVSDDPTSRDTLRLFVPAGAAEESSLVALHENGATDVLPMRIAPYDVWEPNDQAPAVVDDPFDLTNPQLAHEAGSGYDWYRVRNVDRDLTLEVRYGFPLELAIGGLEIFPARRSREEAPAWSIADTEAPWCGGLRVFFDRAYNQDLDNSDAVYHFPIRAAWGDSLDVVFSMFTPPARTLRYQVRVLEGARYGAEPDEHEPNDHCGIATEIESPFSTTVSIDSPYDTDWFRFTLDRRSQVSFAVDCRSCRTEEVRAFADLYLYANRAPAAGEFPDDLPLVRNEYSDWDPFEFTEVLDPGEYLIMFANSFTESLPEVDLEVSWSPVDGGD